MLLRKLDTGWPKRMIKWNTYEWYYQYAMGTRFKSMSYKTNTEYNINIGWCKHNLNVIQMSKKLVKFTILFLLPNQIEQTQKQNKTMLMSTMELYLYWMLHSLSKLGLIGDEGFHLPNKGLLCFCNYKTRNCSSRNGRVRYGSVTNSDSLLYFKKIKISNICAH